MAGMHLPHDTWISASEAREPGVCEWISAREAWEPGVCEWISASEAREPGVCEWGRAGRCATHLLALRGALRQHQPMGLPLQLTHVREERGGEGVERIEQLAALLLWALGILAQPEHGHARRGGVNATEARQDARREA